MVRSGRHMHCLLGYNNNGSGWIHKIQTESDHRTLWLRLIHTQQRQVGHGWRVANFGLPNSEEDFDPARFNMLYTCPGHETLGVD